MTSTTATQGLLLGMLRDGCVWSRGELVDALADEGEPAPADAVTGAIDALIELGLAHRITKELISVSRRGLIGKVADPGGGGALQVSSENAVGVGVLEPIEGESDLRGGAEGLPGLLVPAGDRADPPHES